MTLTEILLVLITVILISRPLLPLFNEKFKSNKKSTFKSPEDAYLDSLSKRDLTKLRNSAIKLVANQIKTQQKAQALHNKQEELNSLNHVDMENIRLEKDIEMVNNQSVLICKDPHHPENLWTIKDGEIWHKVNGADWTMSKKSHLTTQRIIMFFELVNTNKLVSNYKE